MTHRPGIDARQRERLVRAGRRFHAAQREQRAAVRELKDAVIGADGRCAASDVADLTGISSQLLEVIQPELRAGPAEPQ